MSIFQKYKINSAQKALDCGFVDEAIEKFSLLYNADPNNIQTIVGLAHSNLQISQTDEALRFAEKAIEVAPNSLDANICLCEVHFSIDRPIDLLNARCEIIKTLDHGMNYATASALNLGNKDITNEMFSQITGEDNCNYFQFPKVLLRLAHALYKRKDYERQYKCAELGLIMFPDNVDLLSIRVSSNLALGNFNDAEFDLKTLLKRNHRNYDFMRMYGYLFRQLKNYDQAIIAYKDALLLRPRSSDVWEGLATSFRKLNRYSEALEAAQNALQFASEGKKLDWVYYELAFSSWKLADLKKGEKYFLEAIKQNPGEYWFYKNLSELYFQNDDKISGEKYLKISETLSMENMRKKDLNAMFDASDGV